MNIVETHFFLVLEGPGHRHLVHARERQHHLWFPALIVSCLFRVFGFGSKDTEILTTIAKQVHIYKPHAPPSLRGEPPWESTPWGDTEEIGQVGEYQILVPQCCIIDHSQ